MLEYLSVDIICSEKQTVFRERSLRKTVSYEEQIMSKDKYPSIFLPQIEAVVFNILQIFSQHVQFWGIFGHMTCLNQSHASEKICWIITCYILLLQIFIECAVFYCFQGPQDFFYFG